MDDRLLYATLDACAWLWQHTTALAALGLIACLVWLVSGLPMVTDGPVGGSLGDMFVAVGLAIVGGLACIVATPFVQAD